MVVERGVRVAIITMLMSLLPTSMSVRAEDFTISSEGVEPSRVVTVRPDYGYSPGPVRVRVSASEQRILRRLNSQSLNWSAPNPDIVRPIEWHIEPTAVRSRTVGLARAIMNTARDMMAWNGTSNPPLVHIVIGRTQRWIRSKVASLNCFPNLGGEGNQYVMGAALCNGRVVVMNLTGYLFLQRSGQVLTPVMEELPEPPLEQTSYLIAERNLTSLAHEWVHIARYPPRGSRSGQGEPTWFREGLSVVLAGMSKVRATSAEVTYQEFHIIRLRKFSNWATSCTQPISRYRFTNDTGGGCEYFIGSFGIELLLSDYGGVSKILRLYDLASQVRDWPVAFQAVYEMSLDEFEKKADRYISYVRAVARRG